jgi:hypothetical protein
MTDNREESNRSVNIRIPKIAIVQINWPISSYTRDFIHTIKGTGIDVDFITTYRSIIPYLDIATIKCDKIVLFSDFSSIYDQYWKIWRLATALMGWLFGSCEPLAKYKVKKIFNENTYDAIVCIEKESLNTTWIATCKSKVQQKLVYWSLELYNEGHPKYLKYMFMNKAARSLYKSLAGFIIQDNSRLNVIKRETNFNCPIFYLPVCVSGEMERANKTKIRLKFGLPSSKTILVSHGNISEERGLNTILEMSRHVKEDVQIIIHGKIISSLKNKVPKNVMILDCVLEERDLLEFIACSDIALSTYVGDSENERLIAYSSHKHALYAKCRLPIISYRNTSTKEMLTHYHWGLHMENEQEVGFCIDEIKLRYLEFQKETERVYNEVYCYESHAIALRKYLNNIFQPINEK